MLPPKVLTQQNTMRMSNAADSALSQTEVFVYFKVLRLSTVTLSWLSQGTTFPHFTVFNLDLEAYLISTADDVRCLTNPSVLTW